MPVTWDELSADLAPDAFTIGPALSRLDKIGGDPLAAMADVRQSITKTAKKKLGLK
jgi:DNA primase